MLRRKQSDMSRSRPVIGENRGCSGTLIVHIHQHADSCALIEAPRHLRNIGRRVAVAQIRLELRLAAFRKYFAVALVIETIDHDPVIASTILEQGRSLLAQRANRGGRADLLERLGDIPGQIDRRSGPLQLNDQPSFGRSMQKPVIIGAGASDPAAHCDRHSLRGWVEVRKNSDQQVAVEIGERHSVDLLQIEKFSGIGAGLNDTVIGLADDQ